MKTKDGRDAILWCGRRSAVSRFVDFTRCKLQAEIPNGDMIVKHPKGHIKLKVGDWLARDGDTFEVVSDQDIAS